VGEILLRRELVEWKRERDVQAAVITVLLVAAGVILATVIMNRFGDLLSLVAAPEPPTNAA
jgi:hypothetical protein